MENSCTKSFLLQKVIHYTRGWHSRMLCTPIFVHGQNFDQLLHCIDPMTADIFAKILLNQELQRDIVV